MRSYGAPRACGSPGMCLGSPTPSTQYTSAPPHRATSRTGGFLSKVKTWRDVKPANISMEPRRMQMMFQVQLFSIASTRQSSTTISIPNSRLHSSATLSNPHDPVQGGGGISWHFTFAWEISRFKLTAKFPMRNSGSSANFSHTLWALAGGTTQNPGGSAKCPTAKFTTANLTWREIPPPPSRGQ